MNILKIHSSARIKQSDSRELTHQLAQKLERLHSNCKVVERDLTQNLSFINAAMIDAFYKPENSLTEEEKAVLAGSNRLTQELIEADIIIIGAPMYNFTISGCLKAYIDQICRLDKTFATNEKGFEGLLKNKRCYIVATSGGTPFRSPADFLLPYLHQALQFIGITDITEITIDKLDAKAREASKRDVFDMIEQINV